MEPASNIDERTVAGFGAEWTQFDQSGASDAELRNQFERYFSVFPWSALPPAAVGFDLGCGSGRWARLAAERVGVLHCIDASSDALDVARRTCGERPNCVFHEASVDGIPLADGSMDFGYSLGVLHHVPDTAQGIRACVAKLKPGAPLLLYLYYALENRPRWFRALWRASDLGRRTISALPFRARLFTSEILAGVVYYPLARTAAALEALGMDVHDMPLSIYRNWSFYAMRTDALDRFGTRLERRFTRAEVREMMEAAGLERVQFRESMPYWCAVGFKSTAAG